MTREEFEKALDKVALDYPFRHLVSYLKDHDASQRALIEQQATQIAMADHAYQLLAEAHEQQAKELAELREWKQIILGTGTDQEAVIRMASTEYTKVAIQSWKEANEKQAKEIARLREALEFGIISF